MRIWLVEAADTAEIVQRVNAYHDLGARRVVCHVPPSPPRSPSWLSYELLLALGKRPGGLGWPKGPRAIASCLGPWIVGEAIEDVILYRADLLHPSAVIEFDRELPAAVRLWLITPHGHQLNIDLSPHDARASDLKQLEAEMEKTGAGRRSTAAPSEQPPDFQPREPWLARYEALERLNSDGYLDFDRAAVSCFVKADTILRTHRRLEVHWLGHWIEAATAGPGGEISTTRMLGIEAAFCLHGLLVDRGPSRARVRRPGKGPGLDPRTIGSTSHAAVWSLLRSGFSPREIESLDVCQLESRDDRSVVVAGTRVPCGPNASALAAHLAFRKSEGARIGDRLIRPTKRALHPSREVNAICAGLPPAPHHECLPGARPTHVTRLSPRYEDPFYPTPRIWRGGGGAPASRRREANLIIDVLRANGYVSARDPRARRIAEDLVERGILKPHYSGFQATEALRFSFFLDSEISRDGRRPRAA